MLKHLYLVLGATFFFGFITGVIVYLLAHTGEGGGALIEDYDRGISVVVEMYGGCEMSGRDLCPSFRISNDGSYAYVEPAVSIEPQRGEIAPGEWRKVKRLISDSLLDKGFPVFSGTCPIAFDGVAYTYDITIDGESYFIDSCKDDIENETAFMELTEYFKFFESIH